ncbi:sigma 54-interacting transcriptional regulator [Clostridium algidicarnis]|uniref:sigma 54-interacting transcriptional regulator n=1 Tax=Clostridium algidicarnis TaxID=37659 RepID=UPI0004983CBD|nr:sigma 54-interacting transcriptional regulator [Clostridium algidicarnis]
MEERIIQLMKDEDKKNPFTDEQIAIKLHIFRENVTNVRREYDISDSRTRRRPLLIKEIKHLIATHGDLSERRLTKLLNNEGYDVGKYAVGKLKSELEEKKELQPANKEKDNNKLEETSETDIRNKDNQNIEIQEGTSQDKEDVFSKFIGYDGSLKGQISRAKAAVFYPPHGLHTLIYGPSGVGKSFLAELMFKYAVQTGNFGENITFFEFNCADYADNPQLLLAQLFGYSKGAFTGATESKKGIMELCNDGILFLDEVHRLPAEGQEILLYLIDKGKFRRLGETDTQRKSNAMIIAATTENPEMSLLLTFRRRIPMIIEIPPLKERPLNEKVKFIHTCFMMESRRIGREVQVKEDAIKCILGAEYEGNIGQLKSDIQVCCAKAFLDAKITREEKIVVRMESLPEIIRDGYDVRLKGKELNIMVQGDTSYLPDENSVYKHSDVEQSKNMYDELDCRYKELKKEGMSETIITKTLSHEVEKYLFRYIKNVEDSKFSHQEISNIVGDKTLNITNEIYENARKDLPSLKNTIIFPLAIHINMAIERAGNNYKIKHPRLNVNIDQSSKEYAMAKETVKIIERKYYTNLPKEEIEFITMYFNRFQNYRQIEDGNIGLLVVSHGKVAYGMVEIANTIMATKHAVGLEMDFHDSPSIMINKVINVVKQIDQGKGCIILADMGSLITMGEKVKNETGIPIRILGRTDTLMVIEGIQKILWSEKSIDEIADELDTKNKSTLQMKEKLEEKPKQKLVLCLCITGEGAAKTISNHIRSRLEDNLGNVQILTKGYIEGNKIEDIIQSVEKKYEIIAIVGTINPKIDKYPFITIIEIFKSKGIGKLRKIVKHHTMLTENYLNEVIHEENIFIDTGYTYKDEVLDNAINSMIKNGYVNSEFLLSVYKRESLMTTYLQGGIAIPHGGTDLIIKPVISITKLDKPILWDGVNAVDIIFVLALNEDSKKYFDQLYKLISDESLLSDIRGSISKKEILNRLCKNT